MWKALCVGVTRVEAATAAFCLASTWVWSRDAGAGAGTLCERKRFSAARYARRFIVSSTSSALSWSGARRLSPRSLSRSEPEPEPKPELEPEPEPEPDSLPEPEPDSLPEPSSSLSRSEEELPMTGQRQQMSALIARVANQ